MQASISYQKMKEQREKTLQFFFLTSFSRWRVAKKGEMPQRLGQREKGLPNGSKQRTTSAGFQH